MRRDLAKKIGLGRKLGAKVVSRKAAAASTPAKAPVAAPEGSCVGRATGFYSVKSPAREWYDRINVFEECRDAFVRQGLLEGVISLALVCKQIVPNRRGAFFVDDLELPAGTIGKPVDVDLQLMPIPRKMAAEAGINHVGIGIAHRLIVFEIGRGEHAEMLIGHG